VIPSAGGGGGDLDFVRVPVLAAVAELADAAREALRLAGDTDLRCLEAVEAASEWASGAFREPSEVLVDLAHRSAAATSSALQQEFDDDSGLLVGRDHARRVRLAREAATEAAYSAYHAQELLAHLHHRADLAGMGVAGTSRVHADS
jgi:hypothetical protein